jgi:RimJ/RimL family protein N-acetyltransferase
MTKAPNYLETARLRLVPPTTGDAAAIFRRYASDPEVTRFLGWPRHQTVTETESFLAFSDHEWRRAPAGPYLIWSKQDDTLLGATGLAIEDNGQAVTGYVLAKDAWGKGYATEALRAMVDVARQIGVRRLTACCHTQHVASQRVLEKVGFARERTPCQAAFPNLAPGVQQEALWYSIVLDGGS